MSKLFISNPSYSRITSKDQRDIVYNSIKSFLDAIPKTLLYDFTLSKELALKDSFGDLDVILHCGYLFKFKIFSNGLEKLEKHGISCVSINDNVVSFLYKVPEIENVLFHIDFVLMHTKVMYENSKLYYANNIINKFIGNFFKSYNIHVGWNGIFYHYVDSRNNTKRIKIEESYDKFFTDYDLPKSWIEEFYSIEHVKNYLASYPLFISGEHFEAHLNNKKKKNLDYHTLTGGIIQYLSEYPKKDEYVVFKMNQTHQAIVDTFIAKHESLLAKNKLDNDIIESFISTNNIPEKSRAIVFKKLRELLSLI